jgi:hypothetical protein
MSNQITDVSNRVARSTIAVIDTIVQRGGFRGEELTRLVNCVINVYSLHHFVKQAQLELKKKRRIIYNLLHTII